MKVLVVGNGGREHALAWKLLQSPSIDFCYVVPGNGGTATLPQAQNVALAVDDFASIAQLVVAKGIELVVVGPELPLSLGITDYLQAQGIKVFGPIQAGARIGGGPRRLVGWLPCRVPHTTTEEGQARKRGQLPLLDVVVPESVRHLHVTSHPLSDYDGLTKPPPGEGTPEGGAP